MKNLNIFYLVMFIVMIIGKVCNYNEKLIIDLLKFIIGIDIIIKTKIKIKKLKDVIEVTITFITKS